MKTIKFGSLLQIARPEYVYIKCKPNNSIRNNDTHKIARAIAGLHRYLWQMVKKEEEKLVRFWGRSLILPKKFTIHPAVKVSYFMYLEKNKVEFYFILPKLHLTYLKEKITDAWKSITLDEVTELPFFSPNARKVQLVYEKEDALSLAANRSSNELLSSKLNMVDVLEEGDKVGVFYNFLPIQQGSWRHDYRHTIAKVKEGEPTDRNKANAWYLFRMTFRVLDVILNDVMEIFTGSKKTVNITDAVAKIVDRAGKQTISPATEKKAGAVVVDTEIVVLSESPDGLREWNNVRGMAQAFDVISEQNRLIYRNFRKPFKPDQYRIGAERNRIGDVEAQNFIELAGRELLERFKMIEKVETQETEVPDDLRTGIMRVGINTFRGRKQMAYLSTDFEFQNLPFVVIGPNRAGKSTLIGNLGKDALDHGECMVVFDFIKNCELTTELASLYPPERVKVIDCADPVNSPALDYNELGESASPFEQYHNASLQAAQLKELVDGINSDEQPLTSKMKRYLYAAALTVFISNGRLRDVFDVLQYHTTRADFIKKVPANQKEHLAEALTDLQEIDEYNKVGTTVIGTKEHLVSGIIDRLHDLKQNVYLKRMLEQPPTHTVRLSEEIQKSQLICIRMPEWAFPTDSERDVISTFWITKLWLALQIRGKRIPDRADLIKTNVVIDELYQVKHTEQFINGKISRIAKFGAKLIFSVHHLTQIKYLRDELRSTNASYTLVSGCDKENYKELKEELYPYTVEDLLALPRYHAINLIKDEERYSRFVTQLPAPIKPRK